MSLHSMLEHRGVFFEVRGDREGIDLVSQNITDPAAAVEWAVEGATDAQLNQCAAAIVREQMVRDDAAQAARDNAEAEDHAHE